MQYYCKRLFCCLSSTRLGLSQLEGFRRHLLEVLQKSNKPKVTSSHDTVAFRQIWRHYFVGRFAKLTQNAAVSINITFKSQKNAIFILKPITSAYEMLQAFCNDCIEKNPGLHASSRSTVVTV